jgi:hypothetical protein
MQFFDHLADDQLLVIAEENRNRLASLLRGRRLNSGSNDSRRERRLNLVREIALIRREMQTRVASHRGNVQRWIL